MILNKRDYIDSVKGVLILLIVVGHSQLGYETSFLKRFLYIFHVYCFLLLPFMFSEKKLSVQSIRNAFFRYLVPFFTIVFIYSLLYLFIEPVDFPQWCFKYLRGVLTGNGNYLNYASGFLFFWFLPVLFSLNLIRMIYHSVSAKIGIIFISVFIALHLILPAMSWESKRFYPYFGTHIASYVFPVGLLYGYICKIISFEMCRKLRFIWIGVFVLIMIILFKNNCTPNLSNFACPTYRNPFMVALYGLIPIFAMLGLLGFSCDLCRISFIPAMGRYSFQVYIFGQVIVASIVMIQNRVGVDGWLSVGLISVFAGVVIPILFSKMVLEKYELIRKILFPRSYADWRSMFARSNL